jgi:hypothetical protein
MEALNLKAFFDVNNSLIRVNIFFCAGDKLFFRTSLLPTEQSNASGIFKNKQ